MWTPLFLADPLEERKEGGKYSSSSFLLAPYLNYFLMLREIKDKMGAALKTSVNARPKSEYLNLCCDQKDSVKSNGRHRIIYEVLDYLKHGIKVGECFKNDPNTEYFVTSALSCQSEEGPGVSSSSQFVLALLLFCSEPPENAEHASSKPSWRKAFLRY